MLPITSVGLEHTGLNRAHLHRHPAPGHDAGRQGLLSRQQRAGLRHGRAPARPAWPPASWMPPAGAGKAVPVFCLRGISEPDHRATCAPSASTWSRGSRRACCNSMPSRPTPSGAGNAPADRPRCVRRLQTAGRGGRPGHQSVKPAARREIKSMLTRLIDFFKNEQITAMFTSLTGGGSPAEQTEVGHLLADGHLAAGARHRERRRAQSGALHPQVARHGALQPGPRVRVIRPRHRAGGCLYRGRHGC